jgi:hypothetical protein
MRWVWMAVELGALAGAGCATRSVPDHYPRTSAASPEAPLGRPLEVTTSLTDRVLVPCARCAERAGAAPGESSHGHADHGGHDGAH